LTNYRRIGSGRYQEVFRNKNKIIKIAKISRNYKLVTEQVLKYYQDIDSLGIAVPKIFEIRFLAKEKILLTENEYLGITLPNFLLRAGSEELLSAFKQIIAWGIKAFQQEIAFYPLIEQFTVTRNKLFFIDFYPPRTSLNFKELGHKKQRDLALMFFGLSQKIIRPAREIIALKPELKRSIIGTVRNMIKNSDYAFLADDFIHCVAFSFPIKFKKMKKYCYCRMVGRKWVIYNLTQPIKEKGLICSMPNLNLWTPRLMRFDYRFYSKLFKKTS
jgi:hypothetical protein